MIGADLLTLAAGIFQPIIIDATVFLVCFNVSLKVIELARVLTNPIKGGGE